jgi:hypothetical protein
LTTCSGFSRKDAMRLAERKDLYASAVKNEDVACVDIIAAL